MASVCIQQKYNSFPLASVFNNGIQPFRLSAPAGVCSSKNGEIPDSGDGVDDDNDDNDDDDDDNDDLPSVSKIVARARHYRGEVRLGVPLALALALSSFAPIENCLIRQYLCFLLLRFPLLATRIGRAHHALPPPSLQTFASLDNLIR
jgi:hypothetical protein